MLEAKARMPEGYGEPTLGPNSSGLGQVFWYTVESADQKLSTMDLRTLQDWNVRLLLRTAAGVDDVTSWGGDEKQFQVLIQPQKLIKYGISFKAVMEALAANNRQVGGQYVNIGREQYLVRGLGSSPTPATSATSSSRSAKARRSMCAMSPRSRKRPACASAR
jgi:cobalt-zinc-cadmium resistance protein CzcA